MKEKTQESIYTPCSDCVVAMYGDVKNTCGMYTPACTGAQDTCLVHTTLTAKTHIHPRKHTRATVQQCRCHANHCNLSCNLSSAQEIARFHNSPCCSCSWHPLIDWSCSYILVRASSDFFIVRICPWPPRRLWWSCSTNIYFHNFRELFFLQFCADFSVRTGSFFIIVCFVVLLFVAFVCIRRGWKRNKKRQKSMIFFSPRLSGRGSNLVKKVLHMWKDWRSSTFARGVASASLRRMGHPAWALGLIPKTDLGFVIFLFTSIPSVSYDFKSIAGVPTGWALPGYPITAHHSYAFIKSREG